MLVEAARKRIAEVEAERAAAEQKLAAAEERGRLIGEWHGVLVHTDGIAALLDRMAPTASPDALRQEASAQRAYAVHLRARPPRPSPFTDNDELRELRRAEAEAAVAVLRHRESHPADRDGYMRLHALWLNAAARVNAMEIRLYERR